MRRLGGRPPLQRRRDRRGTQAAKACAIIRSQLSQVAVTRVVTVFEANGAFPAERYALLKKAS